MLAEVPAAPEGYAELVQAVMFTDIVGSTAYFERHGDRAGMAMLERHNRLLLPLLDRHQGRLIKTIGDAIMAAFPRAEDALAAAIAMQQALRAHNREQPEEERIQVRIGLHHGLVILHQGDLFGDVVNAAARVEALARAGQILLSRGLEAALPPGLPWRLRLFDAVRVKGKTEPLEVVEALWDPDAPGPQAPARLVLEPGRELGGRYRLLAALGEGGMGQVMRALDLALGEEVALKFVRPELARDAEAIERLKHEVRLARAVTHPNICRIHDFQELSGLAFLSMELIRGRTLLEELQARGPLSPARIVELTAGVAAGLGAAHARGVTHRDLKPSNIMLEEGSGRVVLMDFGIAELGAAQAAGEGASVQGTPEYMAPEQVRGEACGPRADLYALGVILYQLAVGNPPHQAATPVAVAIKHLQEEPVPPQALRPELPERLSRVILHCLAKEPGQRPADVLEVWRALAPEAFPARPRRSSWLGAALALVLLAGAGLTAWLVGRGPPPLPAWGTPRPLAASLAREALGRFSPDGARLAYLRAGDIWIQEPERGERAVTRKADLEEADAWAGLAWARDGLSLLATRDGPGGRETRTYDLSGAELGPGLPEAASAEPSPDGTRWAWLRPDPAGRAALWIGRPDGSEARALLPADASRAFQKPRWSPDGRALAVVVHQLGYRTTTDIGLVEVDTGQLRLLTRDGAEARAANTDPAWLPDGSGLVYASQRSGGTLLYHVPRGGGASTPLAPGSIEDQRQPEVAPDFTRLVYTCRAEQVDLALVELAGGEARDLTRDPWLDRFPVFSPDGDRVAFHAQRRADQPAQLSLVLLQLASGEEEVRPAPEGLRDLAFCGPDSLVFVATRDEVRRLGRIWLADGREETLLTGYDRLFAPTCLGPDGPLAFHGRRLARDPLRVHLFPPGGEPRPFPEGEPGVSEYPAFAPDGGALAYRWAPADDRRGEAELRLAPLAGGPGRRLTREPSFQRSRRRLAFLPGGQGLVYAEEAGNDALVWRLTPGGAPTRLAELKDAHLLDYALSPDGRRLVFPRVHRKADLYLLPRLDGPGGE
jgi:class 3 adenylate cyclase/Tol biopolymer transport system component